MSNISLNIINKIYWKYTKYLKTNFITINLDILTCHTVHFFSENTPKIRKFCKYFQMVMIFLWKMMRDFDTCSWFPFQMTNLRFYWFLLCSQWYENLSTCKSLFIFYRPNCSKAFWTNMNAASTDFLRLLSCQRHRLQNLQGAFIVPSENQLLCWKRIQEISEVTFFKLGKISKN